MGRLKVTPKGKVKKNVPITRIGKKQYLKRRFAHIRAVDVAGANNRMTQEYIASAGGKLTAEQSFTHLGLRMNASASVETLQAKHQKLPQHLKQSGAAFSQEEKRIREQEEERRANYIGRPVSEQEGTVIASLLEAYGTDLKRMTYDHKKNPFQLNTRQLQRQIVNYLRWEKAAFPKAFEDAEKKGWFSVEMYADPKLRLGAHPKAATARQVETKESSRISSEGREERPSEEKATSGSSSGRSAPKKASASPVKKQQKPK